jgi:hypothetical protein
MRAWCASLDPLTEECTVPTIDEPTRHDLYLAFEELLGAERTAALMTLLPPTGWSDVVTRGDLRSSEARLDAKIDGVEERLVLRLDALRFEVVGHIDRTSRDQMRLTVFALVGALAAHSAVIVSALAILH